MSSLKSQVGCTRTTGGGIRWLLPLVGASLLVFTTGCPLQLNDGTSQDGYVSGALASQALRLPNLAEQTIDCEPYVLAIAIPPNHQVVGLEVFADGRPATVDFQVNPTYQNLLRDSLDVCGFDPANHDLLTVTVEGSEPCSFNFIYEFSFFLFDEFGVPQDMDRLIAGGALESDLLTAATPPTSPLTTFDCVDETIDVLTVPPTSEVPALSSWGLVVLALLLMAGGKVYYGRRRSATIG